MLLDQFQQIQRKIQRIHHLFFWMFEHVLACRDKVHSSGTCLANHATISVKKCFSFGVIYSKVSKTKEKILSRAPLIYYFSPCFGTGIPAPNKICSTCTVLK